MYNVVHHRFERPAPETVEGFRGIWSSTLADTMGRHGVLGPEIRPIFETITLLGVAFTVQNYPDDNVTTHRALQLVQPGDVLVIDEGNGNTTGAFGHNMSLEARKRGVTGLVTNGHIRDVRLLREERFPVYCRGVSPRSAQKNTPGSINVPVAMAGVVVSPGDIVVGDDDGVAIVPRAEAREILQRAQARMQMEHQQAQDIRNGDRPLEIVHGRDWLDKTLAGKVKDVP
jgi:4-hydroxy-4-methyl-2-oxoglutarate aldolase